MLPYLGLDAAEVAREGNNLLQFHDPYDGGVLIRPESMVATLLPTQAVRTLS